MQLEITSDQPNREFEQACRDLYLELKLQVEEGDVTPAGTEGIADERFGLETFHQLIMTGMSLSVFAGVYNLLKLWLENRPTCEVIITYPNGFQLKVSKISLERAKKLHEEHSPTDSKSGLQGRIVAEGFETSFAAHGEDALQCGELWINAEVGPGATKLSKELSEFVENLRRVHDISTVLSSAAATACSKGSRSGRAR